MVSSVALASERTNLVFASLFCVHVLYSFSPSTPQHSSCPWVSSSLISSILSSFFSSPGVQLCIPEWTRWLWSAVIWLFALQPFWIKAKELYSPESFLVVSRRHPCSTVFGTVLGRNAGSHSTNTDWWNPQTLRWEEQLTSKWQSAL